MIRFLIVVSLILAGNWALSQEQSIDSVEKEIQANNLAAKSLQIELEAARALLTAAQKAQADAQAEYEVAKKDHNADAGGFFGFFKGEGRATRAKYEAAQKKLDIANEALKNAEPEFNLAMEKSDQLERDISKGLSNQEEANRAFASALNSERLMTQFSVLTAKAGSVNTALNKLGDQLDQAAIGAYLKDKLATMLNSDLMCQAQKQCTDKTAKIPSKNIEDTLFPGTAGSSRQPSAEAKQTGAQ